MEMKEQNKISSNTLLAAVKNGRFKDWFFEWRNGHPFLLSEEVDIIIATRDEEKYKWMNDEQIQRLIRVRVKEMYKKRYPNAQRWSLAHF